MAAMGAVAVPTGYDRWRSPPIIAAPESDGGYPVTTGVAVPAGTLSPPLIAVPTMSVPVLRTTMTPAPMPPSAAAVAAVTPSGSPEMPQAASSEAIATLDAAQRDQQRFLKAMLVFGAFTAAAVGYILYQDRRHK